MTNIRRVSLALLSICAPVQAENAKPFDAASAFGARPSVTHMTMSPDGSSVAYIVPTQGQGAVAYTLGLAKGSTQKAALRSSGEPYRLEGCRWVANDRLVCHIYGIAKSPDIGLAAVSRMVAVNSDGSNLRELSTHSNWYSRGYNLYGGDVIDWHPGEDAAVLMIRNYLPDTHLGSHFGSDARGLGVDLIDTRTLAVKHIEPARNGAAEYFTDGRGTVRMMTVRTTRADYDSGVRINLYRLPGSREWHTLGNYNEVDHSGFDVYAVDGDLNVAYGFKKKDGRSALYSVALDESKQEQLIYARPDVDVDELIRIGPRGRVVGTSYARETRETKYFAPEVAGLMTSLAKALPPGTALQVVDTSLDEGKMLIFAGSDRDPGVYYIFDRPTHQLETFMVVRAELEGVTLAAVKPITYPASDGTPVPGYLTLPRGRENAKGLPALVLPHGGPSARDDWGFHWLAQYYANRGFAVLQPNFRGSSGFGEQWFAKNGFRSWRIAIGDVLDAGRWLVHEGIADPTKLAIVGWSYGGYAALQSAVVDSSLFRAVVAIAPVTDLPALKEESRYWSNFELVREMIGDGPHTHEGSPLEHADKIKVPVLLFHGGSDRNVSIEQSRRMAARLAAVGAKCELITWDNLDHQLEDSSARAQMLRKSDEFLRASLGL